MFLTYPIYLLPVHWFPQRRPFRLQLFTHCMTLYSFERYPAPCWLSHYHIANIHSVPPNTCLPPCPYHFWDLHVSADLQHHGSRLEHFTHLGRTKDKCKCQSASPSAIMPFISMHCLCIGHSVVCLIRTQYPGTVLPIILPHTGSEYHIQ